MPTPEQDWRCPAGHTEPQAFCAYCCIKVKVAIPDDWAARRDRAREDEESEPSWPAKPQG